MWGIAEQGDVIAVLSVCVSMCHTPVLCQGGWTGSWRITSVSLPPDALTITVCWIVHHGSVNYITLGHTNLVNWLVFTVDYHDWWWYQQHVAREVLLTVGVMSIEFTIQLGAHGRQTVISSCTTTTTIFGCRQTSYALCYKHMTNYVPDDGHYCTYLQQINCMHYTLLWQKLS